MQKRIWVITLWAFVISTFAVRAFAEPVVPLGGEFQLNSYTTGAQEHASVSSSYNGSFVAVWESEGSNGSDDSGSSIQGRLYAADGIPITAEFQVNSLTAGNQRLPAVAVRSNGEFFVVWAHTGDDFFAIHGQGFDSNGNPIGDELQLFYMGDDSAVSLSVTAVPGGGFVVMWSSYTNDLGDGGTHSVGQLFDADFQPVGDRFSVAGTTVAVGSLGDFLVVWELDLFGFPPTRGLYGSRYASDGSPLGEAFLIDQFGHFPAVDVGSDGRFVVVWEGSGIQGALYSSTGEPIGSAFQVNSFTTGGQRFPAVAVGRDNGFVVAWQSNGSSGSDTDSTSVHARRFGSSGDPEGAELQVNTYTSGAQAGAVIADQGAPGFVVVWSSEGSYGSDDSSTSIQGQRFSVGGFSVITVPTLGSFGLAVLILALLYLGVRSRVLPRFHGRL